MMDAIAIVVTLAVLCTLVVIPVVWKARRRVRATTINNPRMALFNCAGAIAESLIAADEGAFRLSFSSIARSSSTVPTCEVLFVYCSIGPDGSIGTSSLRLREIIRASGAALVVLAMPNSADRYTIALDAPAPASGVLPSGAANIVLTLDRRGDSFGRFFAALFERMRQGIAMPTAWAHLSPQYQKAPEHEDLPSTVFLCELGGLRFAWSREAGR